MNGEKWLKLLGHGIAGWALCAATMGIGMAVTTLQNALVMHAIAAPVFFAIVSFIYFRYFRYTTALQTALVFLGLVVTLDLVIVALLVNHSLDMFRSLLGTWIPFILIFGATYLTGVLVAGHSEPGIADRDRKSTQ